MFVLKRANYIIPSRAERSFPLFPGANESLARREPRNPCPARPAVRLTGGPYHSALRSVFKYEAIVVEQLTLEADLVGAHAGAEREAEVGAG